MGIPQYLAMTDGEIAACARLPPRLARMGCHFSDDGLVGLPQALPRGALLVLDDRVSMAAQDPEHIFDQLAEALEKFSCTGLLLDFQQKENAPQRGLVRLLARELTVPLAAPPAYAAEGCRLFLPPVAADQTVEEALSPWAGKKIWLDTAPAAVRLELTKQGCTRTPLPRMAASGKFKDPGLCCNYSIEPTLNGGFQFTLYRDHCCIEAILEQAAAFGAELAVGLSQEWET